MAGIEIVASIIGVAGAGFRLSLILNAVSCEIANAPAEILTISKSVTLFSLLLKQTATVLDQPGSVHSPDAIRVAEQVLEESNGVFAEINAMLDRVRTKNQDGSISPSIPQRIRWCFKKHSIEYLLGRMDRLQMSLSLMLQIIQLGSTMASTSRHDPPQKVKEMSDKIRRERVEAQNIVVLFSFENKHLDRLYRVAKEEENALRLPQEPHQDDSDALTLVSTNDSQLTKVNEVWFSAKDLLVEPPKEVLPDFDDNWYRMAESKEDMVTVSEQVIDRLLERWTKWRDRRDQELRQSRSKHSSRYKPVVDDVYDDEENNPFYDRFQNREDSPNSMLLEGATTDWRQPHSTQARQEKRRLRRSYVGYQPSVSAASSDLDDSPASSGSRKKSTRRHVITSDQESSQSDSEHIGEKPPEKPRHPRRRSSPTMVSAGEKPRALQPPPILKSSKAPVPGPQVRSGPGSVRPPISPTWSQYQPPQTLPQQQQPLLPQQQQHPPPPHQRRSMPAPDQNKIQHTISAPGPSLQTYYNNGYPPPYMSGPQSPTSYLPTTQQTYPFPSGPTQNSAPPPRYAPPRLSPQNSQMGTHQQRPKSRDGKPPRSPSRLSREYPRDSDRHRHEEEEERRRLKKEKRSKISDGAVKGLLAGGGLAVFLEALDALDL